MCIFLLVEKNAMSFEVFDNQSIASGDGAGIQPSQFAISKGAKAVITCNCGPNAVKTLSAERVAVFLKIRGTINEAIEKYKIGDIATAGKV